VLVSRYFPTSKQRDVFVLRAGEEPIRLTRTKALEGESVFAPKGRRIAFLRESQDRSRLSLMVIRSDGTGIERVARGAWASLSWSPDGKWITYLRFVNDKKKSQLVICGWDSESLRMNQSNVRSFDVPSLPREVRVSFFGGSPSSIPHPSSI
jgi:Tol biopolymer transport system component